MPSGSESRGWPKRGSKPPFYRRRPTRVRWGRLSVERSYAANHTETLVGGSLALRISTLVAFGRIPATALQALRKRRLAETPTIRPWSRPVLFANAEADLLACRTGHCESDIGYNKKDRQRTKQSNHFSPLYRFLSSASCLGLNGQVCHLG